MVLMVLAFAGIGGFMYWLNQSSEAPAVVVDEAPEAAVTAMGGTMVTFEQFAANPAGYAGQVISVPGVRVASLLGNHAFWTELATNQPYLVRVNPELFAQGLSFTQGGTTTIQGTVVSMSDSVLDAWEAGGAFTNDVQRLEAEFAESFFEATAVDVGG